MPTNETRNSNKNTVITIVLALITSGTISEVANQLRGPSSVANELKKKVEESESRSKKRTDALENELREFRSVFDKNVHEITHEYELQEAVIDKVSAQNGKIIRLLDITAFKIDFYHGTDGRARPQDLETVRENLHGN